MRQKIKDLREDNDFFQKDIADILNITIRQYRRLENNENELSYNKLIKLANFYNVSSDYILGHTNKKRPYVIQKGCNKIKALRIDNNLYQRDIANILNITQQQYQRIENGKNELSYDGLIKLAEFYHTSIDYILGRTNKKEPYSKGN